MSNLISQNIMISTGLFDKDREYWLNRLAGELSWGDAAFSQSGVGEPGKLQTGLLRNNQTFNYPGEITAGLKNMAKGSENGVFIILLTALYILQAKYTGKRDIIIGAPVLRQEEPGDYLNQVVALRASVELSVGITFKDLLLQVRQVVIEAYDHMNYPFERILRSLDMNAFAAGENQSVFDMMVVNRGIHDESYWKQNPPAIVFVFNLEGGNLECEIDYNRGVMEPGIGKRLHGHLLNIIREVMGNPLKPLSAIEVLSPEEKHQLLLEFNDTAVEITGEKILHRLFEGQAERNPDRIALAGTHEPGEDQAGSSNASHLSHLSYMSYMSYNELNQKAQELAGRLHEKGIQPDTIVAIMVERSIEMIIGLFAILKAGGAYLPIDPGYPEERIRYMLADSNTNFLLTAADFSEKSKSSTNELITKSFVGSRGGFSKEPLATGGKTINNRINNTKLDPTNLAYIIYTSGTTGRPKGVAVEHGGAVNTLLCRRKEYKIKESWTAMQLFSFSFDGFVTAFFTPVISGALVVLPDENRIKDIKELKKLILRHHVNHFISVPALYRVILEKLTPEEIKSLKVITLAGDNLTEDLLHITRQKHPNLEIVNEFGVTESSIMSTMNRHQEKDSVITIGKPVWNTRIYIVDRWEGMKLQPVGVPGELCIGGEGVARGYINKPELTADKFDHELQDYLDKKNKRFCGGPGGGFFKKSPLAVGGKIYKTGDLAVWRPEGKIQFLGRIDTQVKVRGFRIELAEIENQLSRYDKVKEAVVLVKSEGSGESSEEKYICAYIVPGVKEVDAAELREHLSQSLPNYMVPSYFVILEQMPLTPNGKIDRKELLTLKAERHKQSSSFIAPGTDMEKIIAETLKEVLKIENPGINDNFFDLGGTSFDIIKVNSLLEDILKREFPVVKLFKYPTIAALAQYLTYGEDEGISEEKEKKMIEKSDKGKTRLKERTRRGRQIRKSEAKEV